MSKCLRALIGALFVACLPGVSEGAIIQQCSSIDPDCVLVGEFNWAKDDIFGGVFELRNLSTYGFADEFTALAGGSSIDVQLEGSTVQRASLFNYPIYPTYPDPAGSGITTTDLTGVTGGTVRFLFHGVEFSARLTDLDTGAEGALFASTLIRAQPIPEPTTLLLLGSGAVVSFLRHRRRRTR